jgi:sugar phosphate isomerase/epimerase
MQVGVSSRVLWAAEENLSVSLDFASKVVDAVELWMMPPFFPSWRAPEMKGDLDRLKDVLTVYDLDTTIHAPSYDLNLSSLNPAAASCAVREVEKCLEVADLLGSKIVTFHPGRSKLMREKGMQVLKANFMRLDAEAKNHAAALCLENMAKAGRYCRDAQEISEVLSQAENINVTLDLAHVFLEGQDVSSYVNTLGRRIRHVHLADVKTGEHKHLPIGEGHLDLPNSLKALKSIGYNGIFMLEGVSKNPHTSVPENIKKLKTMLREAGFT